MKELDERGERLIRIELARRNFWEYCKLMLPSQYKEDRPWLRNMCERLQAFWEQDEKHFMVINAPPRFCKSLTGQKLSEWLFGTEPMMQIITGSYNEVLAGVFAKRVRNAIQTPAGKGQQIQFGDVFPDVKVSKKDAAASMWSIEGSPVISYLATSMGGTATGVGCRLLFVDDLIKNDKEAYSMTSKDAQADWFFNTMMQRLEGNWKVIVIMTRWASDDLAGRILESFDCEHIDLEAWTEEADGTKNFLCPEILDEVSLAGKTKEMNPEIISANYLQRPIDVAGRLFHDFNEFDPKEVFPAPGEYVYAVTDTADKGSDCLCTGIYIERDGIAYMLDYVLSSSQMEVTEPLVAQKLDKWGVKVCFTEANNGGRLFARNVRRLMRDKTCVFIDEVQRSNKEARIMAGYSWCQNYIWFPVGWKTMWKDLYLQISNYNAMAKGQADDAVDMLNYVYMMCTQVEQVTQTEYESAPAFSYSQYYNEPEMDSFGSQQSYGGW